MTDNREPSSVPILMAAKMKAEFELAHRHIPPYAIHQLLLALSGFATNASQCGACQMGNEIARETILRFELATGITLEDARSGEASRKAMVELHQTDADK